MYNRLISLPKKDSSQSFFLFGQRGTGKTTLLKEEWVDADTLVIDLLDTRVYLELQNSPWKLRERVKGVPRVLIDEVQKVPLLLDEVHKLIEEQGTQFALTGSSARKLKKAGVNMLAGRAYQYKLYPLTFQELGHEFDLHAVLAWGSLPGAVNPKDVGDKENFLYTYVDTYLKEEIILEQVVRQIEPFSRFLEVAAQCNGKLINFENIAKDSGVSPSSVKNYFQILEDTLIGFFLPAFHMSKRKRQRKAPKFYFHDTGLIRALQNTLKITPHSGTYEFGCLFETFVINEIVRLNEYTKSRFTFSQLRVDDKEEIDLVVERPGKQTCLIEIKSKDRVDDRDVRGLKLLAQNFHGAKAYLFSEESVAREIDGVRCVNWRNGVREIFENAPADS